MTAPKPLADWVTEYVAYRRSLGYRLARDAQDLARFARAVLASGHTGPLTSAVCLRWIHQACSPNAQHRRYAMVRAFTRYLALFEPGTEVPARTLWGPTYRRPIPHIYSAEELAALLRGCAALRPRGGLRAHTYRTLFGLLAASGLRITEALHLERRDVDLERGVVIVRETKFRKSRLVPLHPSTCDALRHYAARRDRVHPTPATHAFFLGETGAALVYQAVYSMFQRLRPRLGWAPDRGRRWPRLHDLRHTFVCRRLCAWYAAGVDVAQTLPLLSVYLGHAEVSYTYWYLTGIPDLMALTAQRFERFAQDKEAPDDRPIPEPRPIAPSVFLPASHRRAQR